MMNTLKDKAVEIAERYFANPGYDDLVVLVLDALIAENEACAQLIYDDMMLRGCDWHARVLSALLRARHGAGEE